MSIWKTLAACTLAGSMMVAQLEQAAAAPMPTNVGTIKAMVADDTTPVHWRGGGWGFGLGGLAAGAIIGGAIASGGYYGYPGPYYGYGPAYYGYGPYYGGYAPYYAYPRYRPYYGYRYGYYRPYRAYRYHYYRHYW